MAGEDDGMEGVNEASSVKKRYVRDAIKSSPCLDRGTFFTAPKYVR